jgi:hypothetical protein
MAFCEPQPHMSAAAAEKSRFAPTKVARYLSVRARQHRSVAAAGKTFRDDSPTAAHHVRAMSGAACIALDRVPRSGLPVSRDAEEKTLTSALAGNRRLLAHRAARLGRRQARAPTHLPGRRAGDLSERLRRPARPAAPSGKRHHGGQEVAGGGSRERQGHLLDAIRKRGLHALPIRPQRNDVRAHSPLTPRDSRTAPGSKPGSRSASWATRATRTESPRTCTSRCIPAVAGPSAPIAISSGRGFFSSPPGRATRSRLR